MISQHAIIYPEFDLLKPMNILLLILLTLVASVVYASFFEWTLHRFVMHRPLWKFSYPHKRHALQHHRIFRADHTYHLQDDKDKRTIPMAWWNGPVLIAVSSLPCWPIGYFLGHMVIVPLIAIPTLSLYYATYERVHWCFHLPRKRPLEKMTLFMRLNGHHILHHRYMHKNFNVVLPVADLCLGTFLLRSKVKFAQVRGPSVPDVQPRLVRSRVWIGFPGQ